MRPAFSLLIGLALALDAHAGGGIGPRFIIHAPDGEPLYGGLLEDCAQQLVDYPPYRAYGWAPIPPPEARGLEPVDLGLEYDPEAHAGGWHPYRGPEPDPGAVDRAVEWERRGWEIDRRRPLEERPWDAPPPE
jgi:hypothetical protein